MGSRNLVGHVLHLKGGKSGPDRPVKFRNVERQCMKLLKTLVEHY
jgi:hypothetical protein